MVYTTNDELLDSINLAAEKALISKATAMAFLRNAGIIKIDPAVEMEASKDPSNPLNPDKTISRQAINSMYYAAKAMEQGKTASHKRAVICVKEASCKYQRSKYPTHKS